MDNASFNGLRIDEPSSDEEDGGDCVIGLDVGGQLFYTHKSTLAAGSAYFAARFGGAFSAGESYENERGRKVYFVDANGDLFVHILDYLRRGVATWPDVAANPKFHKRLVAEAEYFGVEAMLDELHASASISPSSSGKGILYWLGTSRHKTEYQNPYKMDKIRVEKRSSEVQHVVELVNPSTGTSSGVSAFFEYRPSCFPDLSNNCGMLWCDLKGGKSSQFTFVDVTVKPTHYSLRFGDCYGMSDWNFEASVDGASWDILHEARKDRHILNPYEEELERLPADIDKAGYVAIAEERLRHTWKVNSSSYYNYFRFVSLKREKLEELYESVYQRGEGGPDGRVNFSDCLHGVGFELYGDVKPVDTT